LPLKWVGAQQDFAPQIPFFFEETGGEVPYWLYIKKRGKYKRGYKRVQLRNPERNKKR